MNLKRAGLNLRLVRILNLNFAGTAAVVRRRSAAIRRRLPPERRRAAAAGPLPDHPLFRRRKTVLENSKFENTK